MTTAINTPEQNARRDLYANLMLELRRRTDIAAAIGRGELPLPPMIAYELAYLQFRLIAELIALGSLTAHGDIPATNTGRLTKAYQADAILNLLEQLHPDFYPLPGQQVKDASGKVVEIERIKDDFMTKPELIALYRECGNLLHRGTLRGIKERTPGDFAKITEITNKIVRLLNHHQIQLIDPNFQLWVVMKSDKDDFVHVHVMEKVGPA